VADTDILLARGAFADQLATLPAACPGAILLAERNGLGIATIMLRSGHHAALAQRIEAMFGLTLPEGPRRSAAGAMSMIGTGPRTWLLMRESAPPDWATALISDFIDIASVSDQSSSYAVMRITGGATRDFVSRGATLDLHPDVFGTGSAAVTMIAHIGVILWQVDDAPSYEIAVFRSFAGSFWHWLRTAADGIGAPLARIA